jgi:hypothetical protein
MINKIFTVSKKKRGGKNGSFGALEAWNNKPTTQMQRSAGNRRGAH